MSPAPAWSRAAIRHVLLQADAGTGKTYALAVRYLALVAAGAHPERVLAVTFTRKAAGEILERVLLRLAGAARAAAPAAKLADDLGRPDLDREALGALLDRLCGSLHRLQIGTLDSFFHRVTAAFRFELGLQPAATVAATDDPALGGLRQAAVERALEDLAAGDLDTLVELLARLYRGDAQRSVAAALDRVVLEIYETYRLRPEAEAWRRLDNPYPRLDPPDLAAALDALRDEVAGIAGRQLLNAAIKDCELASRGDWLGFLDGGPSAAVAADPERPTYSRQSLPRPLARAYRPLVDHASWDLLERLARQTEATHRFVDAFDRHFARLRRARGVVLFSDLAALLGRQLEALDDEALLALFYRLDARVEHVLLDELQDTSLEQWRALGPLIDEILAWGDGSRTLFCVGDPKQSIYGWRGGCAELFGELEGRLTPAGGAAAVERLGTSWRSSPVVLDAVDRVFGGLAESAALEPGPARAAARRWAARFEPHRSAVPSRPGWVRLLTSERWEGVFAPDEPPRGEDEDAEPDGAEEAREETRPLGHLDHAADLVAEVVVRAAGAEGTGAGAVTAGVLTLTNRTAAQLIDRLRERGIAASGEGGGPVVDDPAVTAVLSALWLGAHPGDSAAAHHVRNTPLRSVLDPALGLEPGSSTEEAARRIRRAVAARGVAPVVAKWARALAPACSARSGARLAQLVELAEAHDRQALGGPFDFVARARAASVEEPTPAPVRVMTVHRAKGLEFDVVVLPELERRLGDLNNPLLTVERPDPTQPIAALFRGTNKIVRSRSERLVAVHGQEVERRVTDDLGVLYVAMTRARHELHALVQPLAGAGSRRGSRTLAALLRCGLADDREDAWGDGGATLFESGSPVDFAAQARARAPARPAGGDAVPPEPDADAPSPQRARRPPVARPPMARPSGLAAGEQSRRLAVREALRLEPPLERARGVLFHGWLREVAWLDDDGLPPPDRAWELCRRLTPGIERATCEAWRAELADALLAPEVAAAFRRPVTGPRERVELWRERGFLLELDRRLVRGVFDRVVLYADRSGVRGAEVLEIKSDRRGDAIDELVERHRAQVVVYRRCLASMLGLLPVAVRASLVLLDAGRVVAVE
ncbi:MAG TPA: UvrD-helicase domain-containing protein [Thermoanaerobaculia bacterium]|nr:UvrD-helicase domain-containing protein [Thermoanaerobaculia bacterium]